MRSLAALAYRYRCDKIIRHSYIPFYESLFKDMQVGALLEIGIGSKELMRPFSGPNAITGASLWMWQDYFPDSRIYACDIQEDILINEGRIHSFVCDQSDVQSLHNLMSSVGEQPNVIIDDGSHVTEHQILTANTLLPYLKKGGVYVIEDVQLVHHVAKEVGGRVHLFTRGCDDYLVEIRR